MVDDNDVHVDWKALEQQSRSGENTVWSIVSTLLSGPIVWGAVGMLVDRLAHTGRVFTASGVLIGFLTAFYIVYVRYGKD